MSGVNVAGQVLFVFMIFVNTICMSGGIFLTQFYGANDEKGMQQAFRFKLVFGLAAFIPYFFVCIVFPRQTKRWQRSKQSIRTPVITRRILR